MAYNILGIHPGHNGSAALISNGELVYYLEEERLSRRKRDGNPFRTMVDICSKYKIDELIIGGTNIGEEYIKLTWTAESPYVALIRKYYPDIKVTWLNYEHHLLHAFCAFYNSGFKEASCLIIDGAGSYNTYKTKDNLMVDGFEAESIWTCNHSGNFESLYKTYGKNSLFNEGTKDIIPRIFFEKYDFDDAITLTKTYEAVTGYLGWSEIEAGKTMGLAPYGKSNPNIPPLFKNGRGNRDVFIPRYPQTSLIDIKNNPIFKRNTNSGEWHKDPSKLTEIEVDLAWQVQNDTQEEVAKLIEKSVELTGNKQICIAGGYGLNCVTNYFLKKRFPELEIYHEPLSYDGGTAIGAAYRGWVKYSNKSNFLKQTSIYYGPKYTTDQYLKTFKNYNTMFNKYKTTPEQIAKLISERNIVTIFQGRSEAGPRALGNRSILYDPTDPNGKDYVNKVKNREWFRPFAGTVLLEKANEWFDMAGLEESPFMMYAMDVWPDKQEIIQAITHVDGTCRIQTVTEEQNPHYYKLIQEFEKITGVPILFNTSFNLAGDPLVETIEDALETMLKSEMKYMYVPELEMLLEKK
jgi:carbamoyltransferase